MKEYRIYQGAILTAGSFMIATGATMYTQGNWRGLVALGIGCALVYWREMRKENEIDKNEKPLE